jgi:protein involved in polysaccharide export with SLBB domain
MIRFIFVAFFLLTILFTQGCDKILEPVSFGAYKNTKAEKNLQEEFGIDVKGLTFETASLANKSPYSRRIILAGSGSGANLLNESDFLDVKVPNEVKKQDYRLGIGDELSFNLLKEYKNEQPIWPPKAKTEEYVLGVGDQLTFVQLNEKAENVDIKFDENGKITATENNKDKVLKTEGAVGTNGNILLLGVGSIKVANRTLNDLRTEVRNILIRNGLVPNFQLEISTYRSKKAYVVGDINGNTTNKIISLNNIPITLKEVALTVGLTGSSKSLSLISLNRDAQTFELTAGQLFSKNAPEIIIQDKDQIEISISKQFIQPISVVVGTRGNILLPDLGSISAVGRTLLEVQNDIENILIKKNLMPIFQLDLEESKSRKAFLTTSALGSMDIPLSNSYINLKEFILENSSGIGNASSQIIPNTLSIIKLTRDNKEYQISKEKLFSVNAPEIWIKDRDQIQIVDLQYKLDQVFALSGSGNAKIINISPSNRETLADVLFAANGALNNSFAKRSEVYLLRGQNPSVAYHLDAQDVSRILVAAKTELRPNDIIFVAERPIISFSRTLSELLPLRILLRDLQDGNIP